MADAGDVRVQLDADAASGRPSTFVHTGGLPLQLVPGSMLQGQLHVRRSVLAHVEVSLEWYTEGRGNAEKQTPAFQVFGPAHAQGEGEFAQLPFHLRVPLLPLTYHGQIVKIHWRLQVCVYPPTGFSATVNYPVNVTR